jgi:HlyD family secretion protein
MKIPPVMISMKIPRVTLPINVPGVTISREATRPRALSLVLVAIAVAVSGFLYVQGRGHAPKYRFARVERGPLVAAVSATGTLNAVITVQVGSQISGQIKELLVDFNSVVKKGQVIARIDPELFEAKVVQAGADLDVAKAGVLNQEGQIERTRAEIDNAQATYAEARAQTAKARVAVIDTKNDLGRKTELFGRQLIARSDLDTSQAAHDSAVAQQESARAHDQALASATQSARAQLRMAEAMLASARAQLKQKEALFRQAQYELDHTTIYAPVDGVVISRQVDVGQTVAASLQAPILFTIAQDLTQMQVETSVAEADIGRVSVGGRALFTVDAFPNERFTGRTVQIRKAAQAVQNVVTYIVIVSVDNPHGRLLPGMTADVRLVVAELPNVVKIPNTAMRFRPSEIEAGPSPSAAPQLSAQRDEDRRDKRGVAGRVWVLDGDRRPAPVTLTIGLTDGNATEVLDGNLKEGQQVIIGFAGAANSPDGSGAPRLRL